MKDGVSDAGKFFNLFFKIDRYNAIKENKDEYKVIIYDIDESIDIAEDSMNARAKEQTYDLKSNPRTLMNIGSESVSLGVNITGIGIRILRYEGDSLETRMSLETHIELNA